MTIPGSKLRKRRLERHRADLVSLGFGLFFLILAAWWSVNYYLHWRLNVNVPNLGWIAAGVLILVGVLGVVASLRGDREPSLVETAELPANGDRTDESANGDRTDESANGERTEENISATSEADEAAR